VGSEGGERGRRPTHGEQKHGGADDERRRARRLDSFEEAEHASVRRGDLDETGKALSSKG
jgi:hypothetical protein